MTMTEIDWYDSTDETVHLVPVGSTSTLCGIDAPVADQEHSSTHLGVPIPYYRVGCRRCRAAYVRTQLDEVDISVDNISEGDGVVFWDGGDPTDPSDRPLRRSGIVKELPPYKMFEGTDSMDTVEIMDKMKIQIDRMTTTHVPMSGRVYRVIEDPGGPDDITLEDEK